MNNDHPNLPTNPTHDPDLTAYALNELDPRSAEARAIEAQIADEPELAAYVEQVQAIAEQLKASLADLSTGLSEQQQAAVTRAIARETKTAPVAPGVSLSEPLAALEVRPLRFPRKALLAAGLALAAGAAITTAVLLNPGNPGTTEDRTDTSTDTTPGVAAPERDAHLQGVAKFDVAMSADFENTPFADALGSIRKATGADIDIDWPALHRRGVNPETPITLQLDNVPAGAVLALVLQAAYAQSPHPDPVIWTATDTGIRIEPRSAAVERRLAESGSAFAAQRVSRESVKPELFRLTPDLTAISPETFISNPQTRINLRRQQDAEALASLQQRLRTEASPEEAERVLSEVIQNLAAHKEEYADAAVLRGQLREASEYYLEAVSLNADDAAASKKYTAVQELIQAFQQPIIEADASTPMAGIKREEITAQLNRNLAQVAELTGNAGFIEAQLLAYQAYNLLRVNHQYFDRETLQQRATGLDQAVSGIETKHRLAITERMLAGADEQPANPSNAVEQEVMRRIRHARAYQLERNYDAALREVDAALRIDPNNEAAAALKMLYEDITIGMEGERLHRQLDQMRANQRLVADESLARYDEALTYPGDWPEVTNLRVESNTRTNRRALIRNLEIQMDASNSGSFSIGAGIQSESGVFGSIQLEQQFFDVGQAQSQASANRQAPPAPAVASPVPQFTTPQFSLNEALSNTTSGGRPGATEKLGALSDGINPADLAQTRNGLFAELDEVQDRRYAHVGLRPESNWKWREATHYEYGDRSLSDIQAVAAISGVDRSGYFTDRDRVADHEHERRRQIEALRRAGIDLDPSELVAPEPFDPGDIFAVVNDNPFLTVFEQPKSTFSVDVDTAGYTILRRQIMQGGSMPQPEHVRIEEMINYFTYDYEAPEVDPVLLDNGVVTQAAIEKLEADQPGFAPFATHTEVTDCPWAQGHKLVRIGIKGMEVADYNRPPAHLTFLVDVSGSMSSADKLPLVQQSLKLLLDQLNDQDKVSIVVYAGATGVVLEATAATDKQKITDAIDNMRSDGGTAGAAGIELAYQVAQNHFIDGGVNRVILCTDGDFNVGVSDTDDLIALIKDRANPNAADDGVNRGVYLSAMGFGTGNLNDSMMELITNAGNGNYAYIDSLAEATKVMYDQAGATLVTIAKDVKIQVDFDPSQVFSYRLIGYENRILATEDFDNDKVDAGDIGAGHTVTALYEIVPFGDGWSDGPAVKRDLGELERNITLNQSLLNSARLTEEQQLKLTAATQLLMQEHKLASAMNSRLAMKDNQTKAAPPRDRLPDADAAIAEPMMIVNLRYKPVDAPAEDGTSRLIEHEVAADAMPFDRATEDFRFAASVAGLGMALRQSPHFVDGGYDWIIDTAEAARTFDPNGYRAEFVEIAKKARELAGE